MDQMFIVFLSQRLGSPSQTGDKATGGVRRHRVNTKVPGHGALPTHWEGMAVGADKAGVGAPGMAAEATITEAGTTATRAIAGGATIMETGTTATREMAGARDQETTTGGTRLGQLAEMARGVGRGETPLQANSSDRDEIMGKRGRGKIMVTCIQL